jgi:hypothetical protein
VVPRGIEPKQGQGAVAQKTEETRAELAPSEEDGAEEGLPEAARKLPKGGRKVKPI